MSIKNWNAGIIRPVAVAPAGPYQNGAAPGVWTLDQVAYWQKLGLWPVAGNVRPVNDALFAGGGNGAGAIYNTINYVDISSIGNATDFGDLSSPRGGMAGAGGTQEHCFLLGMI